MSDERLFPAYIPRDEEQQILEEAAKVHADRQSRVVLLYGPGGWARRHWCAGSQRSAPTIRILSGSTGRHRRLRLLAAVESGAACRGPADPG